MGLFDNIIGNGAVEEVDPLGMEHITDESNSTTTDQSGSTGSTGTGGSTGSGSGGMFGGFATKQDDSKGQDGSVLIIKNDTPDTINLGTPQEVSPVIDVGGIDTNSEIPDIDIGGDMNFGAIIEEADTSNDTIKISNNTETNGGVTINNNATTQEAVVINSNTNSEAILPTPGIAANISQIQEISVDTNPNQSIPAGGVNSLFGNIINTTPTNPETITTESVATAQPINIGLIELTQDAPVLTPQPSISNVANSTPTTENTINILSGLTSVQEIPTINTSKTENIPETPIQEITTSDSIGLVHNDQILETASPKIISLDTPPEQISPTAVNIATDIQKTKESLAERISEFLKELEALKANDEALLKEKQAAIAKLEEAKKPIEEELQKIKDDEKRINETIDLLSNLKNI